MGARCGKVWMALSLWPGAVKGGGHASVLSGLAGAAAAFVVIKVVAPIESVVLWLEIVIYAAVFLVVAIAADRAMARYGRNGDRRG